MKLTQKDSASQYSVNEERVNIVSHAIGFILGAIAFIVLLVKAIINGMHGLHFFSLSIYILSLCTLYAASTLYHYAKTAQLRSRLKRFDHCAIFVFIAGSYTPFALMVLPPDSGWTIFISSWALAFTGIMIKLFFMQKVGKAISALMYIAMGWQVMFVFNPLADSLPHNGLMWLFIGGVLYTVGGVIYAIKVIPFNHAIFHILTLAASTCHFMTVWFYLS